MTLSNVYLYLEIGIFVVAFTRFHDVLEIFIMNESLNFANSTLQDFSMHHNSWTFVLTLFFAYSGGFLFIIPVSYTHLTLPTKRIV